MQLGKSLDAPVVLHYYLYHADTRGKENRHLFLLRPRIQDMYSRDMCISKKRCGGHTPASGQWLPLWK